MISARVVRIIYDSPDPVIIPVAMLLGAEYFGVFMAYGADGFFMVVLALVYTLYDVILYSCRDRYQRSASFRWWALVGVMGLFWITLAAVSFIV